MENEVTTDVEEAEASDAQKKRQVPDREFVIAWQQGESPDQVAEALGLKRSSAVQRACTLRKKGVMLKRYPKPAFGRAARDDAYFADLNALAGENGELCEAKAEEAPEETPEETSEDTDSDDSTL